VVIVTESNAPRGNGTSSVARSAPAGTMKAGFPSTVNSCRVSGLIAAALAVFAMVRPAIRKGVVP
jgi:hypothetical protein